MEPQVPMHHATIGLLIRPAWMALQLVEGRGVSDNTQRHQGDTSLSLGSCVLHLILFNASDFTEQHHHLDFWIVLHNNS